MLFLNSLYLFGTVGVVVILAFAFRARCWLLVVGYLLQFALDAQVLFRKYLHIRGLPTDEPSPAAVFLNRSLSMVGLILITVGIVQLLHRYTRLRASTSAPTSQP